MSTDEQIAKLKADLENVQTVAQKHHDAWQQHLGAAGYIQGRLLELEQAKAKTPARGKPNIPPPMPTV